MIKEALIEAIYNDKELVGKQEKVAIDFINCLPDRVGPLHLDQKSFKCCDAYYVDYYVKYNSKHLPYQIVVIFNVTRGDSWWIETVTGEYEDLIHSTMPFYDKNNMINRIENAIEYVTRRILCGEEMEEDGWQ